MSNNPAPSQATRQAREWPWSGGRYDGLGVGVFDSLCAVDIDHCIAEDGTPSSLALDIVSAMESYTGNQPPAGEGYGYSSMPPVLPTTRAAITL